MNGWMYGWRVKLMALAMAMAANTSSTEAINSTGKAESSLALYAVTAAENPFIGK